MSVHPTAVFRATSMLLQLVACIVPLCLKAPRRRHAGLRVLLAVGMFYAGELLQEPIRQMGISAPDYLPVLALTFAITMSEAVVAVLLVCRVSPWQALFCCTAGYIGQNLVSGLDDTLDSLAQLGLLPVATGPLGYLPLTFALVYPLYLALFVRGVRQHNLADISEPQIVMVALVVVATVIGLDVAVKTTGIQTVGAQAYLMARGAHGVLCAFTLFAEQKILTARQLATEREVERRMAAERERQYELSRANIDAINVKCHDLRHQIRALADGGHVADGRALADLAEEVSIYDSAVQTGNLALDTILTEKGLVCQGEKITLSVIADGHLLDGLEPQEIYAFFGNALDNAIRAVREIAEPERRLISLYIRRTGSMCSINIENSCDAAPAFVDGLPQTSKADATSHGFGTRSMRGVIERHGGVLTLGCDDGVFHVDALLPLG